MKTMVAILDAERAIATNTPMKPLPREQHLVAARDEELCAVQTKGAGRRS